MEQIGKILEGYHSTEALPRVWWIGSGHASALPFHAAGEHQPGSTDNVLSKVISPYAPSMRFLTISPESTTANNPPPPDCVLIATMSSTPGFPDLPKVQDEGRQIKNFFNTQVQIEDIQEPTAKQVEEVSETFYSSILEGGSVQWDDRKVATALHKAVLSVRDQYPRQPLLWAQFVHFGS